MWRLAIHLSKPKAERADNHRFGFLTLNFVREPLGFLIFVGLEELQQGAGLGWRSHAKNCSQSPTIHEVFSGLIAQAQFVWAHISSLISNSNKKRVSDNPNLGLIIFDTTCELNNKLKG
jgi:hypothetical protein